jgi:cytochrome c oxidase subunit IV
VIRIFAVLLFSTLVASMITFVLIWGIGNYAITPAASIILAGNTVAIFLAMAWLRILF